MVIMQESPSKEYDAWLKSYVSEICRFRDLVRLQDKEKTPDAGQRRYFFDQSTHISKKIGQKGAYAERAFKNTPYELTFEQIKKLSMSIREKAVSGKTSKKILEELNQERAEKSMTATL